MADLRLAVACEEPLREAEGVPAPMESVTPAEGVVVSQELLLSDQLVYAYVIGVMSGVTADVVIRSVMALMRNLAHKNPKARFTLEQTEVTLDEEDRVRQIVTTRLDREGD